MNILRNIEKSLIGHVENKSNVDAMKKLIQSYFDNKKALEDAANQKYNKYVALFENERINNNLEYNAYLNERAELYNAWKTGKNKAALMQLVKLERPTQKEVPDIYTYSVISLADRPVAKPNDAKPVDKAVAKPVAKPLEKKCAEGQIVNPKTGRCIKDKTNDAKPVAKPVEKKCAEGQIVNPKTGRCIKDKPNDAKPVAKPVEKKCPEGQVLNPKTGRCIKDKPNDAKPVAKPVEKKCPEGQVLNPKTGRCIKDKANDVKLAAKPVEKQCPEGQVLNPKTGRCIKDPALKKTKKVEVKE